MTTIASTIHPPAGSRTSIAALGHTIDPERITTFQAALLLTIESGDFDRDWHNLLLENRRQRWTPNALKHGAPRGNKARLSTLRFRREGRQAYYRLSDIRRWLIANGLVSS